MTGLRKTLAETLAALGARRQKLGDVLDATKTNAAHTVPSDSGAKAAASGRQECSAFGANPGNLRMFVHVPEVVAVQPALVIALHGCGQTAQTYARGTGWSTLADRHGFVVVYPEQQRSNNANTCFSWFLPGDSARDQGEAQSIQRMTEHAIVTYGIDRRRVFVTGLSAGGAMASVMLATYPEVYAGGAIIAGLAYGSAGSVQAALEAMFSEQSPSARALGDRVRAASQHQGPWPTVSVWHGGADAVVKPSNGDHSVRQWANVLGISESPTQTERIGEHTRRTWRDAGGKTLIEQVSVAGMAHGVPLAIASGAEACGVAGPFFIDVGLCSTSHLARSWGLTDDDAAPAWVSEPVHTRARPVATPDRHAGSRSLQQIIAAALRAAGLKR